MEVEGEGGGGAAEKSQEEKDGGDATVSVSSSPMDAPTTTAAAVEGEGSKTDINQQASNLKRPLLCISDTSPSASPKPKDTSSSSSPKTKKQKRDDEEAASVAMDVADDDEGSGEAIAGDGTAQKQQGKGKEESAGASGILEQAQEGLQQQQGQGGDAEVNLSDTCGQDAAGAAPPLQSQEEEKQGQQEEGQQQGQPPPEEEKQDKQQPQEERPPDARLHLFEYPTEVWDQCDPEQPLVLVEKIWDSPYRFRQGAESGQVGDDIGTEEVQLKKETRYSSRRLLALELCSKVALPKNLFLACQRILPKLWRLEIAIKVHQFVERVGLPMKNPLLVRKALCKPDYERLETVGDSYLKFVMGGVVVRKEPYLLLEGLLHDFRVNLVRSQTFCTQVGFCLFLVLVSPFFCVGARSSFKTHNTRLFLHLYIYIQTPTSTGLQPSPRPSRGQPRPGREHHPP